MAARTLFVVAGAGRSPGHLSDRADRAAVARADPRLSLPESYSPGSRDERVYELILDEIRTIPVLPFHLPEPESEALRHLCLLNRQNGGELERREAASMMNMSERTLNRHFQQQTGSSI